MSSRDNHCHILPGLDDGAHSEKSALDMARALVGIGVRKVVATPHVISDVYPNSSAQIVAAGLEMSESLQAARLPLELVVGAEYYVERAFLQRIDRRDLLAFGEERYVLFETPKEQEPMLLEEVIFNLKSNGYTPLLAHPERYRYLQDNPRRVESLKRLGVRFQVNYSSLYFPRVSRSGRFARLLYIKGLADCFGTDMHHARERFVARCTQMKRPSPSFSGDFDGRTRNHPSPDRRSKEG